MMKKNNIFHSTLFIVLMALLFLPLVQEHVEPFSFKSLNGVSEPTAKTKLTFGNYASGTFQNQVEVYIGENFGFREPVIRLYNLYLWSFFRKTNSHSVVIGKNNYLFGREVIDDYKGCYMYNYADHLGQLRHNLRNEAIRLRKVQEILLEYNKHLFVLMEPSKAKVYPEFLPDHIVPTSDHITAADIYPLLFDSLGVNYLNFDTWFQQIKDSVDYELYPQTGTHWSNIAALYATDSILRYMRSVSSYNLPELNISPMLFDTNMVPDSDLENLLNIGRKIRTVPNQYAHFEISGDTAVSKPSFLTIGDSYFWNISYHIPLERIFSKHHFWYYNSTIYYDAEHHSTSEVNIAEQLMNADFVMVSYCTTMLYSMSNSFSSKAIVNLCFDKEEIKKTIQTIVTSINASQDWLSNVQEKAAKRGISVDDMLWEEAEYVLYSQPEPYFPELNTAHPTSRNNMLRMYDDNDPIGNILRNMQNDAIWMERLKQKATDSGLDLETIMVCDAEWLYQEKHL